MAEFNIYRNCEKCNGTGQVTQYINGQGQPSTDCPTCGGVGKMPFADYGSNIIRTYKIVDATDSTEYGDLSAANKDAYKMIISCGVVDLTEGTSIRTKLWNMFGEGTTTRENLEALLV